MISLIFFKTYIYSSMFKSVRRYTHWLTVTLCCAFLITNVLAQTPSADASQVAQISNTVDASILIKSWMDKTRASVRNLIAQESSVSKEIEVGYARLQKSCELAAALKLNTPKVNEEFVNTLINQFDERLTKVAAARNEVIANAQTLQNNLKTKPPDNCGLFSRDALPCQIYASQKEMAQYLLVSANTYYDILDKRYRLYKAISLETSKQCIRPDFLTKLRNADEEYLVVYERKSTKAFFSLLQSVQDASINKAFK